MMTTGVSELYQDWYYTPETSKTSGTLKGVSTIKEKESEMSLSSLQKDDFLKLLLAQLRNQDPLNPAENTEFVAQLAQFSTLEQMTQMNASMEKSLSASTLTSESVNNAMMISYFGKTILAETADFVFDGETAAKLNFNLDAAPVSGKLEILNSGGDVVRSVNLGVLEAGNQQFIWDGLNNRGASLDPGAYSFKITAEDAAGEEIGWVPMFSGKVEGISRKEGQSYLFAGGVYIPLDKVRHISESGVSAQ
ncbi:MAG: flagellar hook assembly protein FlgD [Candidatus Latescibacterota bacterium]